MFFTLSEIPQETVMPATACAISAI